ncbi:MAG: tRNA 2-selenouridine(34) synthase MnmH [Rhodobacteraceae bacterium]|nr:tRNA 2-selenouridine(34) synthase MnmH [Paracoccaceae bacterium]
MAITLTALTDLATLGFDTIIDVRSPAEFEDDHIPGAISLPVLDNAERARVGTIYKQVNPFTARKIGGALVARNAALHIEGPLADKPGGWRPLVYCWRGGQRSGSFATILSQIGWRTETIAGGYKAYRSLVVQACYDTPIASPVVLLDGNTGSAKTELLHLLAARGVQVIDLEGMANHRGSLFGAMPGGQPGQRAFESRLAAALAALDPARPVVIEAESSKVGNRALPSPLWKAMCAGPRLHIAAPRAARARYLARAYADLTEDAAQLARVIDLLRPLHAAEVIHRWHALAATGAFAQLADELMARHYDPRYDKQRARTATEAGDIFATDELTPEALERLADRLAARVTAPS